MINAEVIIKDIQAMFNLMPFLHQVQGQFAQKVLFLIHEYQVLAENHQCLRTDYLALREAYCELCNEVAPQLGVNSPQIPSLLKSYDTTGGKVYEAVS